MKRGRMAPAFGTEVGLLLVQQLVLANAMHVKNVPGRKTDVNDAMWIADLLAHGLIRGLPRPCRTLRGRITAHHRFLLKLHLQQIDSLDRAIATIEAEVGEVLRPFRAAADRLSTIPGVSAVSASVLVAEIGVDMSRFPTVGHLISWAGLCPENDESAGKRRSTRIRKGAPWLKTTLVQCAWAAVRTKDSDLRAQFLRLKGRRGPRKAIVAVAASILTAAYFMLRDGTVYQDLGFDHFDRRDPRRVAADLVRRLQQLGYEVALSNAA